MRANAVRDVALDARERRGIVGAQADPLGQPAAGGDRRGRQEADRRDQEERALPEVDPHVLESGYVRRGAGERGASVL